MTLGEWLRQAEDRLGLAGITEARVEARLLAAHVLDVDRPHIVAHSEQTVLLAPLEQALARRLNREPLAYIVGWREFYGRPFFVNRHVLIPRPETELLVEETLHRIDLGGAQVLDLGAGSGCIGITLQLERPSWKVTLADISPLAIPVCQRNAASLGANVEIVESDLFQRLSSQRFDAIVSNPPYVAENTPLMPEVGIFEPELALYGGESGFDVYERLATEAIEHLVPGGVMLLELGAGQASEVSEIFTGCGWFVQGLVEDLARIPRVLVASLTAP